ncbi:MAG TPA: hypothetical protein VF020_05360 [Chthoniobacterales bacterium]
MKRKVICGRDPIFGKTKRRTNWSSGNRSVVVSPAGRRGSLIFAALQLIAGKIREKH